MNLYEDMIEVKRLRYRFPLGSLLAIGNFNITGLEPEGGNYDGISKQYGMKTDGALERKDNGDPDDYMPNIVAVEGLRENMFIAPANFGEPFKMYGTERNGEYYVFFDEELYKSSFKVIGADFSSIGIDGILSKVNPIYCSPKDDNNRPANLLKAIENPADSRLRERIYKAIVTDSNGHIEYVHNIERSLRSVYEQYGIVGDLVVDSSIYPNSYETKLKVVTANGNNSSNSMIPINLVEFGGDNAIGSEHTNKPYENVLFKNQVLWTYIDLYILPEGVTEINDSTRIVDVDAGSGGGEDTTEQQYIAVIKPTKEEKDIIENHMDAIRENSGVSSYRLSLSARNYPDNEYTQKLFQFVRKYFAEHPMTYACVATSVFGSADTFGAHYYLGGVQQLYGARNGWVFRIGSGIKGEYPELHRNENGVNLTQFISNTGFDEIEFRFNKQHVSIMDNTFSATKPSLWGTWSMKITYDNPDKPYPYVDETGAQGFVPYSFVKAFRAAKISQAALDVFCKNTIWTYCVDWNGAWAEKIRCWHNRIAPAYGCEPYSEDPRNVVKISYHKHMDTVGVDQASMKVLDSGGKPTLNQVGVHGSLLETFMDSSITDCQVVLDCKFIVSGWQMAKTFATYRNEEGVSPMVEVRLKNLGNLPEYRFDSNGAWDGKNNTKKFSQASIDYLIDNLLDLTKYAGKEAKTITNGIFRSSSKIYAPPEWEGKISDERLRAAKAKGVEIYINNILKN